MTNQQQSGRFKSPLEKPFGRTTVTIPEADFFLRIPPALRDTAVDLNDYMQKACMDDILKEILSHVRGEGNDIHFSIPCYIRQGVLTPDFVLDFINECLRYVYYMIMENEWFSVLPNLEETRRVLRPILTELTEQAKGQE